MCAHLTHPKPTWGLWKRPDGWLAIGSTLVISWWHSRISCWYKHQLHRYDNYPSLTRPMPSICASLGNWTSGQALAPYHTVPVGSKTLNLVIMISHDPSPLALWFSDQFANTGDHLGGAAWGHLALRQSQAPSRSSETKPARFSPVQNRVATGGLSKWVPLEQQQMAVSNQSKTLIGWFHNHLITCFFKSYVNGQVLFVHWIIKRFQNPRWL